LPLYKLTEKTKPPVFPFPCAHSWGEDQYGLWMTVSIAGVDQTFRWCPPGEFIMGSSEDNSIYYDDEKEHHVVLTKGFWIAETACCQELWESVMNNNPSEFIYIGNPVENISYYDCYMFFDQLHYKIPTLRLRLPTEAEWEYACRAGTKTIYNLGNDITTSQANYLGVPSYSIKSNIHNRNKTIPVKTFPCNDWGLYEMHGNIWEWCADRYLGNISCNTQDPIETSGSNIVARGVAG